jgi:hypothetical protein
LADALDHVDSLKAEVMSLSEQLSSQTEVARAASQAAEAAEKELKDAVSHKDIAMCSCEGAVIAKKQAFERLAMEQRSKQAVQIALREAESQIASLQDDFKKVRPSPCLRYSCSTFLRKPDSP